jgi:hypothetical protein
MQSAGAIERRLIFQNLANGVPPERVAQAFHRSSVKELMDDFRYVANKIKGYMFARTMPFIPFETPAEAKRHRLQLFDILKKLNLDVVPLYSKFEVASLEDFL